MSLEKYPSEINIEIIKYLNFEDILNLYNTNKTILKDVDKYYQITYKKSFKQLCKDNKCLHCNNLCDQTNFKICDKCSVDTCWTCFNKVGNINLWFMSKFNLIDNRYDLVYKCFGDCKYKCVNCKRIYNYKNDIKIVNCITTCIACNMLK
jgi:hypothetical protein